MQVFKVFYQENAKEIPVRENTKTIYVEAENIPEVLKFLENRNFNIEFVQELSPAHLEFEKKSDNFKLEKVNG
ncbi:DNA-dependent RNA polymerase auxiliary subunit epsilon family protein [Gemella sp. zg-570]|nr:MULTISPECIES: DNA-directed RNA polymerase subunit epsilon [unclassified Gemella]MBU0278847.1 DNA-dependent RNA polymerase auxiliary subunit epsilon family protein [Gemella sp. zg-1178]QWQ39394.1 DNA-dependent RNA polymerase auxiliary subunit epsilon family protein [Gemella sp. zg-570]